MGKLMAPTLSSKCKCFAQKAASMIGLLFLNQPSKAMRRPRSSKASYNGLEDYRLNNALSNTLNITPNNNPYSSPRLWRQLRQRQPRKPLLYSPKPNRAKFYAQYPYPKRAFLRGNK